MSDIKFEFDGIGHFIKDKTLKVPSYQRPYSWTDENINALFNDIENANGSDYFIGNIVVKTDGTRLEIIDGQQRIATLYLFYVALRDFLKKMNDEIHVDIERDYVAKKDMRTKELTPKLELGANDNNFLEQTIIQKQKASDFVRQSHDRIKAAYNIAFKNIERLYSLNHNKFDRVFDLVEYLQHKLKVIIVYVSDEDNAFNIFETLNDRGIDLSKTDLIKNFLFNKSGNKIDEAIVKWERITSSIEYASKEKEILDFIRYQWSSKKGLTREKELFENIKSSIKTPANSITYLGELEDDTQRYLALLNPNHTFWNDYVPHCTEYIEDLITMQIFQNRPLLLSTLRRFSKKDIEKALKIIVAWNVRNLITGTTPGGTLEREFSNQAKEISEGRIKNAAELRNAIKNIVPTDQNFKAAFAITSVAKSNLARYYLIEIEKAYQLSKEKKVSKNTELVNLEHILPEKADFVKDWKQWNEEDHKSYYKRLGNLTLLDKILNSNQRSDGFSKKLPVYETSDIVITKNLKKYSDWEKDSIEKRQEEFAEKAVKIWSLKF